MDISTSQVIKLAITNIEHLDPVAVYLEDVRPSAGKVTVTCFNDSWSYFWGNMGEGTTLQEFLISADKWYIANKFAPQLETKVINTEAIEAHAKKHIINRRKDGSFSKDGALERWKYANETDFSNPQDSVVAEALYKIYGDEWWYALPTESNPKYDYLLRVIDAMKQGIAMMKEQPG